MLGLTSHFSSASDIPSCWYIASYMSLLLWTGRNGGEHVGQTGMKLREESADLTKKPEKRCIAGTGTDKNSILWGLLFSDYADFSVVSHRTLYWR